MLRGRYFLSNLNHSFNLLKQQPSAAKVHINQQIYWLAEQADKNYGPQVISQYQRRTASTTRHDSVQLRPEDITKILTSNETFLTSSQLLPTFIKSIECNQLASNNPIEDRLRVSSIQYPGLKQPTLMLGIFDGHGGGTTADIICRRLFNYIALSLHPDPRILEISDRLSGTLIDLHNSPKLNNDPRLKTIETEMFCTFRNELVEIQDNWKEGETDASIVGQKLKTSFQRCDDDLSKEIQENLVIHSSLTKQAVIHYANAAVSGCCAIVVVVHQDNIYVASTGDCRAVLGLFDPSKQPITDSEHDLETKLVGHHIHPNTSSFKAVELNDEHNCFNINESRRVTSAHPKSEQNTVIKHNRLLGNLMPFRAFGDFQYKWKADLLRKIFKGCPEHYETPPYLITEPDVKVITMDANKRLAIRDEYLDSDDNSIENYNRYIVMASDGLWELFESSRDVVETIVDHTINAYREGNEEDYDENSATYLLRSALRNGPHQDIGLDQERRRQLHHTRLQSTLSLPSGVARNYRDDISLILLKL